MQRSYRCLKTFYFLSEGARCGASQKKSPRDSTKRTARGLLLFSDVPQIAAYHKKLLEGVEYKVKLSILVRNKIVFERETTPRVDTTYTLLELVDINIGVAILLETR